MKATRRVPRHFTMAHALMVMAAIITFLTVTSVLRDRQETVDIVVASQDLVAGSGLEASSFTTIQLRADSELVGQLATSKDLLEPAQLGTDLSVGEPLLVRDIRAVVDDDTLRTIAIPVWRSTIDGLGLRIGDRVDLIGADITGTLRYVVTDSAVSRLPRNSAAGAFGSSAGQESWITIQVTDQEALQIASALRAGDVEVVRSTGAPVLSVSTPAPSEQSVSDSVIVLPAEEATS